MSVIVGAPAFSEEFLSAEDYEQPSRVILMHSLPRFGHNANFAKLVSSNQEEQVDYVVGILATAFFILSIFIFWAAAIVSCKCLGRRRIGFLSGRMHLQPDKKGRFRPPLYLWKLRYTFLFLGCAIIGSALMLAMPALRSVINASKSSQRIHREIKGLTDQGLLIVADLSRVKKNVNSLNVRSILQVEKLCPDYQTFLSSDESLNDSLQLITDEFDDVNNLLEGFDFESLRDGIDFVNAGINHIDKAANIAQDNDWMVKMYVLVLAVMVFFMLLAATEIVDKDAKISPALQMMVTVFIFPMFVICVVIAVISAVLIGVMGTANSDFCAVGPEVTVSNILFELGLRRGTMIYDTFEYYQSGCKTKDPMALLYKYEEFLQRGITSASSFLERFNEIGMEEMNDKCGANVRPLVEVISVLRDNLGILLGGELLFTSETLFYPVSHEHKTELYMYFFFNTLSRNYSALRSTFEASSCSRVSPIYKQTFNANACEESASGLTLMFMVTITVAAIGMVMIMLRSAMRPYKSVRRNPYLDQDEKIPEHEEYKTYVDYMSEFVGMWKGKGDDDSSEPTATWSGSMESKSEEEKPLSPETPSINMFRPTSFLLSPGSNSGEMGLKSKTPRARTSSLMFSPANGVFARNYFNMHSPLSSNSSIVSPSSQIARDAHDEEEQPLSPETPSWDNNWGSVDKRFAGSSPLSLGSNEGRMTLSPLPDVINDEGKPLSPETPAISWDGNKLVESPNESTSSSEVSKHSIPSLRSGNNFNEADFNTQPDSSEVADSLLAVGFIGAVLGSPAPTVVCKKKKKKNLWLDDGEDEMPFMSGDVDPASFQSDSVSSRVNSPDDTDDKVKHSEGRNDSLLVSQNYFDMQPPLNMGSPPEDKSDTFTLEETRLSPNSSMCKDSTSSRNGSIRTRFTPQLKSQQISNDQDEIDQITTPQARDDQEVVSEETISKRFNVMRFGSPDFLSPFRGAARDYKKIE